MRIFSSDMQQALQIHIMGHLHVCIVSKAHEDLDRKDDNQESKIYLRWTTKVHTGDTSIYGSL